MSTIQEMTEEYIQVPKAWLETVQKMTDNIEKLDGDKRDMQIITLIGYLSSIKTILKYNKTI